MKLFSKQTISKLLIFITITLFIISIYYAVEKYLIYQESEKKITKRENFENANSFLLSLEDERIKSSLYLANPNQKNLNILNEQRKSVNIEIQKNKNLKITKEIKDLINIRQNINNLSLDYRLLIYEKFHLNIINSIISKIEKLNLSQNSKQELEFIKLRENLNMENSLLAFALTKQKVMTKGEMLFWDKILHMRQYPILDVKKESILMTKIQKIYNFKTFSKIGKKERVELFVSAQKGLYSINLKQWLEKTYPQQQKLNEIQELYSENNLKTLVKEGNLEHKRMDRHIIISLLMFILVGLILAILHILNKDDTILKNTVKEIEVDLDPSKKREIKEILTHNSSSEIYEFLAKEIREPSRAKDLFLANMSHEIRTPLNGIIGFTKELKETKLSEEQIEIVEIIEESSGNLLHIVNDILDFSKIKAGKVELEHIAFDPIEKFEAAVDTYVAKAREKEIELKVSIDPKLPTVVLGDPTKLTQILTNLISNAIKFTPKQGYVNINIEGFHQEEKKTIELKFSVKDSGIGITTKEKKKIFEAFSQADASTSRKYGGTGLGLSIASQFIKRMGGKLDIDSQVGEGSNFFFSILLEKPEDSMQRSMD
ncbi:MAG TPA: hypothetical protein ENK66_08380, partial [Arcobacter sp.]|nr:hypothetical protein [Arcobacter sp.]